MPWVIEKIENECFAGKYGPNLKNTKRFDEYEFSCVIEDAGNGVALIHNASGNGKIKDRADLEQKLIDMGFVEVRWIRVVRHKLQEGL